MAKNPQQNKIGESFEQNLPDELVPDFIWDNISNTLDSSKIPTESTEKIKASFEEGFEEAVVPPLLWTGVQSSLEQASALNSSTGSDNKIKTSFEAGHQDIIPENLWENVETQLEIEGVWKRVLKGLNRRTKRQYWQEKGIQFGIAALALLLLRGCDFGEWTTVTPLANQSNVTAKVDLETEQNFPVLGGNSNATATSNNNSSKDNLLEQVYSLPTAPIFSTFSKTPSIGSNNSSKNNLLAQTYTLPTTPIFSTFLKAPSKGNSETTSPIVAKNTSASILAGVKLEQDDSNDKENLSRPSVKNNVALNNPSIATSKEDRIATAQINARVINKEPNSSNESNNTPSGATATAAIITTTTTNNTTTNNKTVAQNSLVSTTINPSNNSIKNSIDAANNNTANKKNSTSSKELLSETPISTLIGQAFIDPTIEKLNTFEIDNVVNKKRHNIRFEVGMNGKVGTSLLLGNATNKAMETTSMVKTKTRAAGGIGIMLDCYLTANDAIVFGAYPLSNSQQYFGGYTSEGRYYHKEVKLAYFDFTLGYQRTLFHYNDFGTIPSSMYVRLDYGLGYLSKSEEVINGLAAELGNSYNKLNHNVGLTIGNTHRINRFVIDYGIYGNIGLSSVQNIGSSGTGSVEYSNLATMGGYIGLRYVL
jgi:hypothetical protein